MYIIPVDGVKDGLVIGIWLIDSEVVQLSLQTKSNKSLEVINLNTLWGRLELPDLPTI